MKSPVTKILLVCVALSLSGCVGLITGNNAVDGANYAAAALIHAKGAREKQTQENFERDLDKTMRPAR